MEVVQRFDAPKLTLCFKILPISSSFFFFILCCPHLLPKCMSTVLLFLCCISHWLVMSQLTDSATDAGKLTSPRWRLLERFHIKPPIWQDYNYRYLIWRCIIRALLPDAAKPPPPVAMTCISRDYERASWSRRWHKRKEMWLNRRKISRKAYNKRRETLKWIDNVKKEKNRQQKLHKTDF